MPTRKAGLVIVGAALVAVGLALLFYPANAAIEVDPPVNTLTAQQEAAGWRLLFDGHNPAEHWRGYEEDGLPEGWRVIEGGWLALEDPDAGDIITRERFGSFELFVEWKVADESNSGIFYMVQEGEDRIWHSAPEYQVIDGSPGQSPYQAAGALYDLIGSSEWDEIIRPTGEVNTARIIKRGNYLEHHMNGRKLFSVEIGGDQWNALVEQSKFHDKPFAAEDVGHIGLQDHGDWVAYRNIRIRPLGE